jgi:hypothetical protein
MTKKGKWRLLTLATVLFFIGAGIYFFILPIQESKRLEQTLIDRFGWPTLYVPESSGFIEAQRVEKFIRVREAVQDNCRTFQGIMDSVIRLEKIESDEGLDAGEKASEGFDNFKNMFNAAPAFLEFMDARNQALLAEEMGLGEYNYIYLAAYGEQMAREAEGRYAGQEEAYLSLRERKEYAQILGNQLAALEATGPDAGTSTLVAELRTAISAAEDESQASPWPNGPPGDTRESLAPYRERLSALYCEGIVRVEVLQKKRGLLSGG